MAGHTCKAAAEQAALKEGNRELIVATGEVVLLLQLIEQCGGQGSLASTTDLAALAVSCVQQLAVSK